MNTPQNFNDLLDKIITEHTDNIDTNINDINGTDSLNDVETIGESDDNLQENISLQGNLSLQDKLERLSLTGGWNEKNEVLIISIGENAASYKWMHEKSANLYKLIHQILSIILIVFSTGLSAETFITETIDSKSAIEIVRRIFTYIVTLVSVLQSFLRYEKLAEKHTACANSFGELYHNIQQQMCMYRKDRIHASKYISTILKRYDNLIVNGPTINEWIITRFKNTFRNSNISIPDIADRIQKIEIITEPNPQSSSSVPTTEIKPKLLNFAKKNLPKQQIDIQQHNLSRYGICNLKQIHDAFQIHGDISDKDVIELRELKKKHNNARSDFEFNRFRVHETE